MYAWKSSEAKTKRWKSIIVLKKKGKFSLFMTFNFSLYPSYHTIHVFIHISVAAMFYGRYCCCFLVVNAQSLKKNFTRIFIYLLCMLIIWTTPPLPIENLLFKLIHLTCVKLISLGGDVVFVMLWWKHPCYSADIHVVTHFSSTALRHSYLSIKLSLTLSIGMILLQRHPLWRSTRNIFFFIAMVTAFFGPMCY